VQVQELIGVLEARGARLHALEGGRLGVEPASRLTDELRAAIRANRDELRQLVRAAAQPEAREPRPEPADYTAWTRGDWDEFERLAAGFEDAGKSKDEAVALSRQRIGEARARAGTPASELTDAPVVAAREQLGAVLVRSPRFGEVWVVLEPSMAPELAAEEAGRVEPRPVLLAEDVAHLRGKSDQMVRAALAVLAVFPGARLIQ
jgi:hypothetical protein